MRQALWRHQNNKKQKRGGFIFFIKKKEALTMNAGLTSKQLLTLEKFLTQANNQQLKAIQNSINYEIQKRKTNMEKQLNEATK